MVAVGYQIEVNPGYAGGIVREARWSRVPDPVITSPAMQCSDRVWPNNAEGTS
jgi:hypothetical protein